MLKVGPAGVRVGSNRRNLVNVSSHICIADWVAVFNLTHRVSAMSATNVRNL